MGGVLGITGFVRVSRSFWRRWFFLFVGFDGKGLEMEQSMIIGFLGGGKSLVDGGWRKVAHCAPTMDEEMVVLHCFNGTEASMRGFWFVLTCTLG